MGARRTWRGRLGSQVAMAVFAAGGLVVLAAGPASAAIPSPVDASIPDGDPNSLRDVLEIQILGGETVVLQAGATYTLDAIGGDIDIVAAVTIEGNGATIRQTVPDERVLDTDFDLTLRGVTITGGNEDSDGGGVQVDLFSATLTIESSTLTGNVAADDGQDGGAIEADGPLVITNSTISNNSVDGDGGAFSNSATATITGSTFSGNCAEDDGGVVDGDGDVTFVNSTVTGNTSHEDGAIDMDDGTLTLVYSDIVSNIHEENVTCPNTGAAPAAVPAAPDPDDTEVEAPDPDDTEVEPLDTGEASNIEVDVSLVSFGSVVALPQVGAGETGPAINCEGIDDPSEVTSNGFNFSDDATCFFTNTTTGDRENAGDPGLGALASNGGPTQTRLPTATSALLNFIPIASCQADGAAGVTTDQRGISRPQSTGCEIGAVEVELVVRFTG